MSTLYLNARHPPRGKVASDIATHVWTSTVLSCPTVGMVQNRFERNLASLYQFAATEWLEVEDTKHIRQMGFMIPADGKNKFDP